MNKSKTQQISNGGSGSRRAEGSRPGARGRSMRISSVETMVSLEPASSLTASPNLGHWRRSMALRERRALASLRTRVVVVTLTLLPSSSKRYSMTLLRPFSSGPTTTRGGRRKSRSPPSSSSSSPHRIFCCADAAAAMVPALGFGGSRGGEGVGMLGQLGSQLSLAEGNGMGNPLGRVGPNCLWAGVTSPVGFQRRIGWASIRLTDTETSKEFTF